MSAHRHYHSEYGRSPIMQHARSRPFHFRDHHVGATLRLSAPFDLPTQRVITYRADSMLILISCVTLVIQALGGVIQC